MDLNLFEKLIIYNALMDSSYLESIIEHAKPSFFEDKNIRSVFESLSEYYSNYKKIPNITELKVHMVEPERRNALKQVVIGFENIDKNYDKEILLKNSERFFREKAVYSTVLRTSIEVQSGEINTTKILKEFEDACNISLVENFGFDYLENIEEHCEDLKKVFDVIPTGWKWLDERIGGGFMTAGRALYVFYGVTNVGKSIFLGNIATNILDQNKTVVLISLEMSEQVYAKRISSQLSKIAMNDLSMQTEPLKQSIEKYKIQHKMSKLIIKEFPPKSVTPLQIKSYLDRLVKKGIKPDVIVLDYINLLAPPEKGMNSYESVKQITEQIRALTYYFGCPLISATQSNRCLSTRNTTVYKEKDDRYEPVNIATIKVGDRIKGKNGAVTVRHVYPVEKKKVYKIKTESGKEIICSGDHYWPLADGNVHTIDHGLSVGDYLLSATQ